jgi:hypothetical protein
MAVGKMTHFNWGGAFTAYVNNCPNEEIAQVYGMELATLQQVIARDGWQRLRASIPQAQAEALTKPNDGELKLKRLQENREKNLAIWAKLRDDLLEVVDKMRAGELMVERQWHSKGIITTQQVPLTMGDRVNLATYARTICDGTFRCLGDYQATEKPGQDAIGGQAAAGVPSITIILPGVVAFPREQRAIDITTDSPTEPVPPQPSESPDKTQDGGAPQASP